MSTNYVGPIRDLLQQKYPQPNPLWNFSSDNQLGAGWLYATPTNVWGQSYPQFKQAVSGSGSFNLATCTVADGPTQLCQAMDATMTAPGQTPQKLLVGHSDAIVDAMYDVMISAEVLLDVTSLSPPTGRFLSAFKNALLYLSNKPDGQRPIVRVLISNPLPNFPPVTAAPLLQDLTIQLDASKQMRVYVYVMSSSFASWNHSKIVAADGVQAIVGGHNMWDAHYLGQNPVNDVSMRLTGSAARHAQDYVNSLWVYGQYRSDRLPAWVADASGEKLRSQYAFAPPAGGGPSQDQGGVLPDPSMYATATAGFPAQATGGSIPVLAVGRAANTRLKYLLPTLQSYILPFSEPGDLAMAKLVSLAQTSVRMSLQSFRLAFGIVAGWNLDLLEAMADALNRGVDISVVLSNPGAVAGGLTKASAPYDGDNPSTINAKIVKTAVQRLGLSPAAAQQIVSQQLRIAQFRYSADATYPGNVPIPNHAKTIMVDDTAFYIGSQNVYSSNLNEFGYIVEDAASAQAYIDSYWTPLWTWSQGTVTIAIDPDQEISEQIEALQFLMALELDTMLNTEWSNLLAQYNSATDAATKSAIEEQLDEVIVNAGFDTTAETVLQVTPPSTDATPEALRFVANLMNSPDLMAAFNTVVMTPAASVAAYNAAITAFLSGKGYSCTAQQVFAAFSTMRAKTFAYWTGSYTTWLTGDGGISVRDDTAAVPEPAFGPVLVVTSEGVTMDGVAITNFSYDNNALTWSTADGNATSASLQFGTVTRATLDDDFTGNECFGTITYPSAGGQGEAGTYSLYGRSASSPGPAGSPDNQSYTLAYVLTALGLIALLAVVGLYKFVSSQRQQDFLDKAQGKRDEDLTDGTPEPVTSQNRGDEIGVIGLSLVRRKVGAGQNTAEDLLPFESDMNLASRQRLVTSVKNLSTAETELQDPPASTLATTVQKTSSQVDTVITNLKGIFSSVQSKISANSRASIEQNTKLADEINVALDNLDTEQEKNEDLEFTIDEEF